MSKFINRLVQASYVDGTLSAENVGRIADKLTRKELKVYIKALKNQENKVTLRIEVPSEKAKLDEAVLKSIFGEKKIHYSTNPDLILGLQITDNDIVYNMNLKNSLERIAAYAAE